MTAKQIITARPDFERTIPEDEEDYLDVAEFYFDTIQGEGINTGVPAAFLRLQNCTLNCKWCDTKSVWRFGNPYTFKELFGMMTDSELIEKFHQGQHLVLTGGSPLMQQDRLVRFLEAFHLWFNFLPCIEVENECTIMPDSVFERFVDVWNNSPKLENSRNATFQRYNPRVLQHMSLLKNSWFKFVVYTDQDWWEIEEDFIKKGLIRYDQIILMPRGDDQETLAKHREWTVELAIKKGVRYCTREHIVIWNKQTGI